MVVFKDFPELSRTYTIFQNCPGLENTILKFKKFPGSVATFSMTTTDLSMASRLGKRSSARPSCMIRTTLPRQLYPSCIRRVRIWTRLLPLPLHTGRLLTINSVTSPLTPFRYNTPTKQFHVISQCKIMLAIKQESTQESSNFHKSATTWMSRHHFDSSFPGKPLLPRIFSSICSGT